MEFQNFLQPWWKWIPSKLAIQGACRGIDFKNYLQPRWRLIQNLVIHGTSMGMEFHNFLQPWWRCIKLELVILSTSRGTEFQDFFKGVLISKIFFNPGEDWYKISHLWFIFGYGISQFSSTMMKVYKIRINHFTHTYGHGILRFLQPW